MSEVTSVEQVDGLVASYLEERPWDERSGLVERTSESVRLVAEALVEAESGSIDADAMTTLYNLCQNENALNKETKREKVEELDIDASVVEQVNEVIEQGTGIIGGGSYSVPIEGYEEETFAFLQTVVTADSREEIDPEIEEFASLEISDVQAGKISPILYFLHPTKYPINNDRSRKWMRRLFGYDISDKLVTYLESVEKYEAVRDEYGFSDDYRHLDSFFNWVKDTDREIDDEEEEEDRGEQSDDEDGQGQVSRYGDVVDELAVFDEQREFVIEELYFEDAERLERQISTALANGDHILFVGPPGTGKSKLAKQVCESYVDDAYSLVTATADWSTFDTIGGYHPEADESLQFKPGVFLTRFQDEQGRPQSEWLIIDEMNRADIDKAFGSLFSALTGDDVTLPFTADNGKHVEIVGDPVSSTEIASHRYLVPDDWRLIATMNTYDKSSLYEMSYAFMRRLAFIPVEVPSEIDTDVIDEYVAVWEGVDPDAVVRENVASLWQVINEYRRIGPAVVEKLCRYLDDDADYASAIVLHVMPQFEGMLEEQQIEFVQQLRDEDYIDDWVYVADFAADYFAIDRRKFDDG